MFILQLRRVNRFLPVQRPLFVPTLLRSFRWQIPLEKAPKLAKRNSQSKPYTADIAVAKLERVAPDASGHVLYSRKLDWYIRMIIPLAFMQLLLFANFAELIINHWDEAVEPEEKDENGRIKRQSAPLWKRWGVAGISMVFAGGLAAFLLQVRRRIVRRIVLLPQGQGVRLITAADVDTGGRVVEPAICQWGPGRDPSETFVQLPGLRMKFGLTFADAEVLGEKASASKNRRRFEEAWRTARIGGDRSPLPVIP